jgi:hypothetical protein
MARNSIGKTSTATGEITSQRSPRSLDYARRGIKTSHDFANLMSALMSDLIEGNVAPNVGLATANAGGKLLKVVEMQYKYGTAGKDGSPKTLVLSLQE